MNKYYSVLLIILLIIMVCSIYYIRKTKIKVNETKKIIEDKLRDDALNRAICNQIYGNLGCSFEPKNLPYEVDYSRNNSSVNLISQDKIMLMVTELSELSRRKYILDIKNTVSIGNRNDNDIVIKSVGNKEIRCEIFRCRNEIYIRDYSDGQIILQRKKNNINIYDHEVKIKSGDMLIVRGAVLELKIVT